MRRNSDKPLDWLMGIFAAITLSLLGWVGMNVSRIPVIENQITNIQKTADMGFATLRDHELRIRTLESANSRANFSAAMPGKLTTSELRYSVTQEKESSK